MRDSPALSDGPVGPASRAPMALVASRFAARAKRDVGAAGCTARIESRAALAAPRGDGDVLPAADLVQFAGVPLPEKGSVASQSRGRMVSGTEETRIRRHRR